MTDSSYTDLTFLLDRSGSMSAIEAATVSGFGEFVTEQRRAPGRCLVTLNRFDTDYDRVYTAVPVEDVPPLVLEPRGMTAMLDAIARTIRETGERLASLPEDSRPGQVIVGIMTDGLENASRETTHAQVKSLIEHQEQVYGWSFLYMGANQDAIEVGASIGVRHDRAMTYAGGRAAAAMSSLGGNLRRSKEAMVHGDLVAAEAAMAFSQQQRDEAVRPD